MGLGGRLRSRLARRGVWVVVRTKTRMVVVVVAMVMVVFEHCWCAGWVGLHGDEGG